MDQAVHLKSTVNRVPYLFPRVFSTSGEFAVHIIEGRSGAGLIAQLIAHRVFN